MFKNIYVLTKLQICNMFGLNEARFSRDQKKRKTVYSMLVAYVLLAGVLIFYAAGLSVSFAMLGLSDVVPLYLAILAVGLAFGLTIFRAGALFNVKSYEKLAVLPVSQAAIVASRFLSLYIVIFLYTFIIMASGGIACGVLVCADVWFYFSMLTSSVFLPLLPMTVALVLGTILYAIVSKFKRKNLTHTIFALAVMIFAFAFPFFSDSSQTDTEFLTDIAAMIFSVGEVLRPILWFALGVKWSGIGYYFLFLGVSVAIFAAFAYVVGKFYKNICSGLASNATKGNFTVGEQKGNTALVALYKRELKRYFSSSIYFTNTILGNILALLFSAMCLFLGVEDLVSAIGVSEKVIYAAVPFLFVCVLNLSPMTACAVSMEGKGWELTRSLPVSAKTVMTAKLLVQYTFSLTSAFICAVLLCMAFQPTGIALVWLFIVPLVMTVLGGVAGLYINIKNPHLHWENEVTAVKQSTSTLLAMLFGVAIGAFPFVGVMLLPVWSIDWFIVGVIIFASVATWYLYKKITSISLHAIDGK